MAEKDRRDVGFFVDRDSSTFTIEINGQKEKYKNIKFYDFDSARKMMTRVVKNLNTGIVYVMAKGADSAIFEKCVSRKQEPSEGKSRSFLPQEMQVMTEIENYASNGFRTLTFAMKIMETDQIDGNFSQEEIESNFTLLGASCVEDLLQTDVSRCLNDFKQAKI
jgi:magnesium-transporting ATPase (P-type)